VTEIRSESVQLLANEEPAGGYLAIPEGKEALPVVVIQEWWGVNEHIKDVARRFAAAGFLTLAPDLYNGQVAAEPDDARKLAMSVRENWDQALAVIQAAVNYLLDHPLVNTEGVGLTGFCMGGGLAWHGAAKVDGLAAVVPFYGGGPEMSDTEVGWIDVPVLAIFGELDQGVSPEVARSRAAQMDRVGVEHETIIYPNAHHAFFNDTRAGAYNPEAAADAWQRMLELFRQTLI
jgi:carboxymethylenebutenolidase